MSNDFWKDYEPEPTRPAPMTTDRALDLALEALEYIHEGANNQGPHTGISWRCVAVKAEPAIKAIKQARALDKKAENARELGLDYEPHKGLSEHLAQVTNGRVRIDPVTGDVGIGTPEAQPAPVQDKVTLIQTNVGIGERAMEAYEASKERDRAALAAPTVQEPFGYLEIEDIESHSEYPHNCRSVNLWHEGGEGMVAIYTTPPGGRQSEDCLTAAQRQWVGLTDEEADRIQKNNRDKLAIIGATHVILREKNQ